MTTTTTASDVRWTRCVGATNPTWKAVLGSDPVALAYVIFDAGQKAKARWTASCSGGAFATMAEAKASAAATIAALVADRIDARAEAERQAAARHADAMSAKVGPAAPTTADPLALRPGLRCELRFTERKKSLVEFCYRTVIYWRHAVIERQMWTGNWAVRVLTEDGSRVACRLSCRPEFLTPDRMRARS